MTSTQEQINNKFNILARAVDEANEAFVTIDQESTVFFYNKAAEKIFGYSPEEIIGHNLSTILGPECRKGHHLAIEKYIKTRKGKLIGHVTEFTTMRKNGDSFPASISFSVSEVAGALYFTGIVRDLTETKALQEQLIQSERLAALGQTVAEINHEIKNPLALIGGFARQLKKNVTAPKDRDKLDIITTEVARLENLLLEFKSLYTPQKLQVETINLCELIEEVHSMVAEECRDRRIDLEVILQESCLLVKTERAKLKQVLLNILKNSIEALDQGGRLRIETAQRGPMVEINIQDGGPGIPEEVKNKIFNPFFTTKKKGTGLGLSVSKRIIEEHEGSTFTVESEEGEGTIVRIALPGH
ncbi:nitrogen regulation protein NR(II) [Thermodesulfobacteriota bacterium]